MTNVRRQLILLCDGTNNNLSGRKADTHVVLLAELLKHFPAPCRVVYYDPGVGNPGQLPGTTITDKARRALDRLYGLAFGRGLYDNVAEGYGFLMKNWRAGDQIFVFGFSRGAFTARSIAGMVNAFGILDANHMTVVPSLVATYFSNASQDHKGIIEQSSRLFGQIEASPERPEIHFVGVWDTVASVGLPPFGLKITAKPTLEKKFFRHVRQALALDEQRAQFLPRPYAQDDGSFELKNGKKGSIQQRWFRGAHCDVGGGNDYVDSELSRAPFAWMVAEAAACGLELPTKPGQPAAPKSEAEWLQWLPKLDPVTKRNAACIVSQTAATPLWALTGLEVRDTQHAVIDEKAPVKVKTEAHPSVAQWSRAYPAGTTWGRRRTRRHWGARIGAIVAILLAATLSGTMLAFPTGIWPDSLASAWTANGKFQVWQFGLPLQGWTASAAEFERPVLALLTDLLLMAAYASLLAPVVCRAFANRAKLIEFGGTPPVWLNRLGWALPLAVGADLLENALTAVALLAAAHEPWAWIGLLLRIALCVASLAKWLGLAGVGALVVTSWWPRR